MLPGSTQPPSLLTEADLIALMDKHGIGTDATHAEHIETIKSREYVFVEDRDKLVPGKLGMALAEGYDAMGFAMSKPGLRSSLEADLKAICDGEKDRDVVLADQINKYRDVFERAGENVHKLDLATQHFLGEVPSGAGAAADGEVPDPVVSCQQCGAMLVLKKTQVGGMREKYTC